MNEDLESKLPPSLIAVGRLLATGAKNSEIAGALVVQPHTVEKYVSELMERTNIHDRVKLALWCREKMGS